MTISPQTRITLLAPVFPRVSQDSTVHWTDGHVMQPWQAHLIRFIARSDWDARHLPAAALIRDSSSEPGSDDTPPPWDGPLVCADPIHLRADRDSATLIPADTLQLRDSEADALLESINDFLHEDALQMSRTATGQWLMRGKDGSKLASYPPSFLAHRNASAFLSDEEEAGSWRRLMTELQMLLHAHPVNLQREEQGRLPVNSVWFWGGAALQAGKLEPGTSTQTLQLFADDPFTVALARYLGMVCEPLAVFDAASAHPHSLLVDTRLTQALFADDEPGLEEAEKHIVNQWVIPIHARIAAGENIELDIFNEDGVHGRLDLSVVQSAANEARTARIAQMSVIERLVYRLVRGVDSLWGRLRNTLSGGAR